MYYCFSIFMLIFVTSKLHADLTTLTKNDTNPPYSTLNLDDAWLLTKQQLISKDSPDANKKKDRFLFSISPFGQNANYGKSIKGQPCPVKCETITNCPPCPNTDLALGDLIGRSGMLALLYGQIPAGHDDMYPGTYLNQAAAALFPGQEPGTIDDDQFIDPNQQFGYFSNILNYRKRGVRFEAALRLYNDLLFRFQAGVSSIRQVLENRVNLTDVAEFQPDSDDINKTSVDQFLMDQVDNIAQDIQLNIGTLNQASVEEVRFNLCWIHAFEVNKDEDNKWSKLLIIPYGEASGSISPGEPRKANQLFSVPFGNNGHSSAGFTVGINFDFFESIEVGGEVGYTHFFKKSFCNYPVPNSRVQTTMFPFQTEVSVQPGNNWHFGLRIAAYHFIENLSVYFEWFVVDHKKDELCLQIPDSAFLPGVLEHTTSFKTKMANLAFNWDVSPNLGLGFLWQIPFSQRNTYRSSTIMGGVNITF